MAELVRQSRGHRLFLHVTFVQQFKSPSLPSVLIHIGRLKRLEMLFVIGPELTDNDPCESALPGIRTRLCPKNLRRMIQLAEVFPDQKIVVTLSRQLGWSHFLAILPLRDSLQRDFYAEMCRMERWSVRRCARR